jgi:hypothetical protein
MANPPGSTSGEPPWFDQHRHRPGASRELCATPLAHARRTPQEVLHELYIPHVVPPEPLQWPETHWSSALHAAPRSPFATHRFVLMLHHA